MSPPPHSARRGKPTLRRAPALSSISSGEARALLRLCNNVHAAPPDPAVRRRRLLEGLCRVLRADAGVCAVTQEDTRAGGAAVITSVRFGISEHEAAAYAVDGEAGADRKRRAKRPPPARGSARSTAARARIHATVAASSLDHCLTSAVPVDGTKLRARVTLIRRPPRRRPFSAREAALLELFHSEMGWLYRPDLPLASPEGMSLTARQRQTLQLLLAGHSEKEVARRLGVSRNTVHHYVKAIHRHFRVSSRSELLARWVRK